MITRKRFASLANVIADPGNAGAINVTRSGICNLTSAGAETRTLAAPTFDGQEIALCCNVDGGDNVVARVVERDRGVARGVEGRRHGDHAKLTAARIASALRWRLDVNDGATLGP